MRVLKIVYWNHRKAWLGYLQDFPAYWTQVKTLRDLREHLKSLYDDISSGEICLN